MATAAIGAGAGWAAYWFAGADERLEKEAVEVLGRRRDWTIGPSVVELTNRSWVGEMTQYSDYSWDYRRTGSRPFPFEAMTTQRVRRWITMPYATKEEAEVATRGSQNFFEVDASSTSFPVVPHSFVPTYIEVADEVYDAEKRWWVRKGSELVYVSDINKRRENWLRRGTSQEDAKPK